MRTSRLATVAGLVLSLTVAHAHAARYPVNGCVSTKQKAAGKYCAAIFNAWAKWEGLPDGTAKAAALAAAADKLDAKWMKAEATSSSKGSDCADTTLTSAALASMIDSAAGSILDEINAGLDLGMADQRKCGGKLLRIAGKKCAGLLAAEGKYIRNLSKDPQAVKRDKGRARATARFTSAFEKQLAKGCPSDATPGQVEASVDSLVADVVESTTVSPNVDDSQFTTITPSGPVQYLGRTLNPTCIKDTPYAFFVKRGSVNKLLVYYEGGGACWEQLTCGIPVCDADVKTTSGSGTDNPNFASSGFADMSNPANPFRDWNVVFVSYCSCDIHFGDSSQTYSNVDPDNPVHIEHRGFQNSRYVEKWAREHFVNPEQVFVTGSSAGAYGAWFNAPLHELVWPASHFQVLADAGNGVITTEFLETNFPNWHFIDNIPKDFPEVKQIIESGGGIPEYTEFVTGRFPDTRWAHYATSYDGGTGGQTGFYNIMLNDNDVFAALSWWEGSCAFNAKMREQAQDTYTAVHATAPDNYRYYIGTGSRHTMWGSNKVYNDTTGGVPLLVDWVNGMLDGTSAWTNVECTNCGLLLPGDPRPSTIPTPPFYQQGSDVVVSCSPSGAFVD